MYGTLIRTFKYIYHQNQLNVGECKYNIPYMDPMGMSENENCSKPPVQMVVFQEFPLPFGTICHREVASSFTKLIIYSSQSPVPGVSC